MPHARAQLGHQGEDLAVAFLQSRGFCILARNWRIRLGEIDIIAKRDNRIHFIEVKTRRTSTYGYPEEAVTPAKVRVIARVGEAWLLGYFQPYSGFQIDVISIEFRGHESPNILFIESVDMS